MLVVYRSVQGISCQMRIKRAWRRSEEQGLVNQVQVPPEVFAVCYQRQRSLMCSGCKAVSLEREGNRDSTSSWRGAKAGGGLTGLIQRLSLEQSSPH